MNDEKSAKSKTSNIKPNDSEAEEFRQLINRRLQKHEDLLKKLA